MFQTSRLFYHVNLSYKYYLFWLYILVLMQSFKKFKFLVIFELGQILGCYKSTPLKKNLVLKIQANPRRDREIPF
jgi:predicted amidophosphoribosyltransferase